MQEIPLFAPDLTELEEQFVLKALRARALSAGPLVRQFEEVVAARCGRTLGVACNSAGSALHAGLLALGVGPGDEVITPAFACLRSAAAIVATGATPVFVDIDPRTLATDPAAAERAVGRRTKALLASATFGNPAGIEALASLAGKLELPLVEDCRGCLGASVRGIPSGNLGRFAVLGFSAHMPVTTGEGGMLVTDDARLAEHCRCVRDQGCAEKEAPLHSAAAGAGPSASAWLAHDTLGRSMRLSDLAAALGLAQMRRLGEMMQARERVSRMYFEELSGHHDLILPTIDPGTTMSWFMFPVRLAPSYTAEERDRIVQGLRRHEIHAGSDFPAVHLHPHFRRHMQTRVGQFPIAESVAMRTIALPFSSHMQEHDVEHVCQALSVLIERENLGRA